ncbi:hypothetical protein EGR_03560 [Echinococcus granulosus]|uniref:PH domain-containing protein n=1 Tax=Echinococcus granulosus TaxID=6210 RepID=W6UK29_ECHGR|nr:hypothetical protein EGR_03560 [Echinococcus granulosus]EUB61496.1 hypothetical protein EGR_03560 [Echinococcus granulosus]
MRKTPSERSLEGSGEQPSVPSPWSQEERMTVVAKLHDLELVNKRLTEEKSHLQRQLNHVLRRLASDRFIRQRRDLEDVSNLLRELVQSAEVERPSSRTVEAPLASAESTSWIESNGPVSITQYSSLSDTFEKIVLEQDPVSKMSLELSSSDEAEGSRPPEEEVQAGKMVDTTATASTTVIELYHSPSSSEASGEQVDWELHIPLSSPALSHLTESLGSINSVSTSHIHAPVGSGTFTTPQTPVLSRRLQYTASLPSSPYKHPPRKGIIRGTEEARRSVSKWLEISVLEVAEKAKQEAFKTPSSPGRAESIVERAQRSPYVPHPLRQALKRSSHKPRIKVGPSEDFLNDFFSSSAVTSKTLHEEGLHAAIIFSRFTEVARELGSLFTHLHAYTCARRHCFVIQSIPAQELQISINYFLKTRRTNFDRLCGEETSSEEARSTAGIPFTTPTIEITPSLPPHPSTSHFRSSSASTEYNVPPTEDSNNNMEVEHLEAQKKSTHHAGPLSKLSSRFKLWQRFWCVMADKSLLFYADEAEVEKWPKKCIDLADVQRVERRHDHRPEGRGKVTVSSAINLVLQSGKIYTLRSSRITETRVWENKIRRALRRVQAERIFHMYSAQLVTSGWLRRYRRGQSHRVWGMLMGTFLVYARDARGQYLTGFRDLTTTYIRCLAIPEERSADNDRELTSSQLAYDDYDATDSESDAGIDINGVSNLTISLWAPNRDPVYLVCSNDEEYERWKYHLHRACWFSSLGSDSTVSSAEPESRFLHLWKQLVRPSCVLHRSHSEVPLKEPLSRIFDSLLENDAIRLSEKLLSLSNLHTRRQERVVEETDHRPSAMYRFPVDADKYNLIKEIAQMCFESIGLKDELFLQLIKQATPSTYALRTDIHQFGTEPTRRRATRVVDLLCHRDGAEGRRAVSTQRQQPESQRFSSPPGYSHKWIPIIVMWECLAIYSTAFLPSPLVLACLQAYLSQFTLRAETSQEEHTTSPHGRRRKITEARKLYSEVSRFAAFCTDMLMRCRIRGGRRIVPSCFEVVAISLRNPYTHSLPFSLPIHIHLPTGYEVVSFDGTMKVHQLMGSLLGKLELSEAIAQNLCHCGLYCRISGPQYVFGRAPARPRMIYLEAEWNVCDVISLYESTLTRTDQGSDFSLEDMTIDIVFLVTAVSKKAIVQTSPLTERIMDIVAHQLHSDLYTGELNIILRGTHFLELTALMCRCDYVDYAELQRGQEISLTQIVDQYFPQHCLTVWGREDDQALIELKLLLLERWNKVCRETSHPEGSTDSTELRLPRPSYAYTMYFWRLHPAGACVRHYPCNLINIPEVPPDETVWLVSSFDKISLLRIYTFDSIVPHPIHPNGIERAVSGMACFKHIPLNRVVSFGVQQTGAFFLVFSKVSKRRHLRRKRDQIRRHSSRGEGAVSSTSTVTATTTKERRSASIRELYGRVSFPEPETQLEKLLFFVRDLCEINELCQWPHRVIGVDENIYLLVISGGAF